MRKHVMVFLVFLLLSSTLTYAQGNVIKKEWEYSARIFVLNTKIYGNNVVVGELNRAVFMDLSGKVLWDYRVDGYLISVAFNGNYIALGTLVDSNNDSEPDIGRVILLDNKGNKIWEKDFETFIGSLAFQGQNLVIVSVEELDIFTFFYKNTKVSMIDLNGNLIWQKKLDADVFYVASYGEKIALGGINTIYLLDKDGNIRWKKGIKGNVVSLAINGKYIVVGSAVDVNNDGAPDKGMLYFFDIGGDLKWQKSYNNMILNVGLTESYVLANSIVFKGEYEGYSTLDFYDYNGNRIWRDKFKYLITALDTYDNYIVTADTGNKVHLFTVVSEIKIIKNITKKVEKKVVEGTEVKGETAFQKVEVKIGNETKVGYRVSHRAEIEKVGAKGVIFRILVYISKSIAKSTDELILPFGVIVLEKDPLIALDIKDPEEGENIEVNFVVPKELPESEVLQGVKIDYEVVKEETKEVKEEGATETTTSESIETKTSTTTTPETEEKPFDIRIVGAIGAVVLLILLLSLRGRKK